MWDLEDGGLKGFLQTAAPCDTDRSRGSSDCLFTTRLPLRCNSIQFSSEERMINVIASLPDQRIHVLRFPFFDIVVAGIRRTRIRRTPHHFTFLFLHSQLTPPRQTYSFKFIRFILSQNSFLFIKIHLDPSF